MAVFETSSAGTTATITVPAGTTVTINDIAWSAWITGSSTTSTGFIDPWPIWNQTPSVTSITIDPWITWNDSITITGTNRFTQAIRQGVERVRALNPELEAAHRRQREADQRVYETRMRQKQAERKAADERAEKLLMSILSSAQRAQYQAERRFTVHLPNGHHYMIRRGRHGNIERIDERGNRLENLCVHVAPHEIPDCDNMAAQKLMIECNEDELRKIANITQYAA